MNDLLSHPGLERLNPARRRLVRMSSPLSPNLNPFTNENVIITPAILYDETFNSKAPVAYELIVDGIRKGDIVPGTRLFTASSGNTGLSVAQICKIIYLPCEVIMRSDTPAPKVGAVSALGSPVNVTLLSSGTVERARERGAEPGNYDTDQYARPANPLAQYKYLAPQLWGLNSDGIDVLVAPGGTLGTIGGLKKYADEHNLHTKFILALCGPGQEVPGARDEEQIRRDVRGASVDDFDGKLCGTRYRSFLASYAMFSEVEWTPGGPTSGLALHIALRFLQKHKDAKTLDQFRRGKNGEIRVVFLCPDDYRLYGDLIRSALKNTDFESSSIPLRRLLGEGEWSEEIDGPAH